MKNAPPSTNSSRRAFVQSTAATLAATSVASAQGGGKKKTLRAAMIGSGKRGTMDARDFLCSSDVEIVAIAEMFEDRAKLATENLSSKKYFGERWEKGKDKLKVTNETTFIGFDAYKKVLEMDEVDIVLLLTPPGFRPEHLRAAMDAGKHVFMEKPAAVDSTGIRSVLESGEMAAKKGLSIVGGTQQRRMPHYIDIMQRVADGHIGDIRTLQTAWHWDNMFWHYEDRKPEWTDMEWQLRCWPYFTWLSGDHIVEQHVHNLDVMNWAMGGPPVKALGRGGRQLRTGENFGNIYDHFAVEYEYENGVRMASYSSQMLGATGLVVERIVGCDGEAVMDRSGSKITGTNAYTFEGETHDGGEKQFADLVESIHKKEPINEAKRIAEATMTGIMGRMSAYTGRAVSWNYALNGSKEDLRPASYSMEGDLPVRPVAIPGKTKLV